MNEVVSVDWLNKHIKDEKLILLDASFPKIGGNESSELDNITIPGARFFDLKGNFSDTSSPFPNTMPSEEQFERECKKLGINQDSTLIVFDNKGIYSSPRIWWMFKIMGHDKVSVLNGGLPEWVNKGFSTCRREIKIYELGNFKAHFHTRFVKRYEDILNTILSNTYTIVDARSEGRFNGTEKEPRASLKSGNIPNSVNIPFKTVLENGKFKSAAQLKKIFNAKCLGSKDLIFTCGSGLTACIILLASELAYKKSQFVYDGSWTEWAEKQNLKEN
tara:strand:+ start:201 stop:1025 length:825 start_codon:yes stop_codon:yes gene_type:complete